MHTKKIENHEELFSFMKVNGFNVFDSLTVDEFLENMNWENWFSNGVVDVKILNHTFGELHLANFRDSQHPVIMEMFSIS